MPVMVDSCVFLDVFSQDARWFGWSSNALAEAEDAGSIVLNPVIYSEIRRGSLELELQADKQIRGTDRRRHGRKRKTFDIGFWLRLW